MPKLVRLNEGGIYAYLKIIRLVADSNLAEMRHYLVQAQCCGTVAERSEKSIRDAARRERATCQACRWADTGIAPGQHYGPALVLEPADDLWRVRWDCCGRETTVRADHLRNLRNLANKGQDPWCRRCANAARVGVPQALRATLRRQDDLRDDDEEPTGYHSGTGNLPPGAISAALAWPRPRLLGGGYGSL